MLSKVIGLSPFVDDDRQSARESVERSSRVERVSLERNDGCGTCEDRNQFLVARKSGTHGEPLSISRIGFEAVEECIVTDSADYEDRSGVRRCIESFDELLYLVVWMDLTEHDECAANARRFQLQWCVGWVGRMRDGDDSWSATDCTIGAKLSLVGWNQHDGRGRKALHPSSEDVVDSVRGAVRHTIVGRQHHDVSAEPQRNDDGRRPKVLHYGGTRGCPSRDMFWPLNVHDLA